MYKISNHQLIVTISPLGAELQSVLDNQGGEWLWQGDPSVWDRKAPLCFPFVGRLRGQRYTHLGKLYQIPTHGFARDMPFQVLAQSPQEITFSLKSTPETLEMYAFSFLLEVTYRLEGNILHKIHRITHLGTETMLYELGGHDGFAFPFCASDQGASCSLELPQVKSVFAYQFDENAYIRPEKLEIPLDEGRLSTNAQAFGLDCYVLQDLPQREIFLLDPQGQRRVGMKFPDFPYLVLWSAEPGRFFCLEPWTSLPECTFVGEELGEKVGIRRLAPQESEELRYETTFYL